MMRILQSLLKVIINTQFSKLESFNLYMMILISSSTLLFIIYKCENGIIFYHKRYKMKVFCKMHEQEVEKCTFSYGKMKT